MRSAGVGPNYPSGQLWVTSWGSQLVDFNSGLDGNYRIASGSTWKNAATNGKDLRADIDGVERATANSRLVTGPHHRLTNGLALTISDLGFGYQTSVTPIR